MCVFACVNTVSKFFVLQGACKYLVRVSHVCAFASVFYVFVAAIWRNK